VAYATHPFPNKDSTDQHSTITNGLTIGSLSALLSLIGILITAAIPTLPLLNAKSTIYSGCTIIRLVWQVREGLTNTLISSVALRLPHDICPASRKPNTIQMTFNLSSIQCSHELDLLF
jgi:hypothetical protein